MAKKYLCSPSHSLKFREASYELLSDFLTDLNETNKLKLGSLSKFSGIFKDKRLMGEYVTYLLQQRANAIQHFSVCHIIWLTNVIFRYDNILFLKRQ